MIKYNIVMCYDKILVNVAAYVVLCDLNKYERWRIQKHVTF
jgi:hypothetical protein